MTAQEKSILKFYVTGVWVVTLILWCSFANAYTLDEWADAIRKAENNANYGILSIKCDNEAQCRQYCKNTVYNTIIKYRSTRCKEGEDDLSCLSRRYAPIGADNDPEGLNANWKKNVKYFLSKTSK